MRHRRLLVTVAAVVALVAAAVFVAVRTRAPSSGPLASAHVTGLGAPLDVGRWLSTGIDVPRYAGRTRRVRLCHPD
jgi:hypothetical protein